MRWISVGIMVILLLGTAYGELGPDESPDLIERIVVLFENKVAGEGFVVLGEEVFHIRKGENKTKWLNKKGAALKPWAFREGSRVKVKGKMDETGKFWADSIQLLGD